MSEAERLALMRWWVENFSDTQLRDIAWALGVESATEQAFAIWRARIGPFGFQRAEGTRAGG